MLKSISFFMLATSIISCNNNKENVAGGGCTFDTVIRPVVVLNKETRGSNDFKFVMQFPASKDSFYQSAFGEGKDIDQARAVQPMDTVQYWELRTVSGSCAGKPQVHFEKYVGPNN